MSKKDEVNLVLTQEELLILHDALCERRYKVSGVICMMKEMGLATDEAQALWDHMGNLSTRMCKLMAE